MQIKISVNPNGMSTLLAIMLITFFINGKRTLMNSPRSLSRNSPNYIISEKVFLTNLH